MARRYYSVRTGKNAGGDAIDLSVLKAMFRTLYTALTDDGFFQEAFGYYCVDAENVPGTLGADISSAMMFRIRKTDLWPIVDRLEAYSEDDLFDVVEFLFDHVSKPMGGRYHDYSGCGWHYDKFEQAPGRARFRDAINEVLEVYGDGFELSSAGEILSLPQQGLAPLMKAELPAVDQNVQSRVDSAVAKFRRHRSTMDERRDAVRDLADVLEYLRPKLKTIMDNADESDLFNLANNFGIRHFNQRQKVTYDQNIWLSWMFYFYLATIHAAQRMINKHEQRR